MVTIPYPLSLIAVAPLARSECGHILCRGKPFPGRFNASTTCRIMTLIMLFTMCYIVVLCLKAHSSMSGSLVNSKMSSIISARCFTWHIRKPFAS